MPVTKSRVRACVFSHMKIPPLHSYSLYFLRCNMNYAVMRIYIYTHLYKLKNCSSLEWHIATFRNQDLQLKRFAMQNVTRFAVISNKLFVQSLFPISICVLCCAACNTESFTLLTTYCDCRCFSTALLMQTNKKECMFFLPNYTVGGKIAKWHCNTVRWLCCRFKYISMLFFS